MVGRGVSLRLGVLLAVIVSAAVGLTGAAFLQDQVERSHEHAADRAKALEEARTIAAQLERGAGVTRLTAFQELLVNDQLTVERRGLTIFRGPPRPGRELEVVVSARFREGLVRIADYTSTEAST